MTSGASNGSGSSPSTSTTAPESPRSLRAPSHADPLHGPRAELARAIPRRARVRWWLGIVLAIVFATVAMATITAPHWLGSLGIAKLEVGKPAPITIRVPPLAGVETKGGAHVGGVGAIARGDAKAGGAGVLIGRGDVVRDDDVRHVAAIDDELPHGAIAFVAIALLIVVLAWLYSHHVRRSIYGRLVRVQVVNLALLAGVAILVEIAMLVTSASVVAVPVAVFALVPTLVLDRVVGLATGALAALVVSLLVPFDVGVTILLLVQAGAAGLVVAERPRARWRAVLVAGAAATLLTGLTYPLLVYLMTGQLPIAELSEPVHSMWIASAAGAAIATLLAVPLVPLYQLLVGEITRGKLVELEDLSHPLLQQIAERSPGTWQHSLAMANMAEIAANTIGANGRLVRVGAYFHDLGKSLSPKYFIENLEPGETSPHDQLPPEASCDAIFKHVTEGIATARRAGLHPRIVDFMHMHHGDGVLEYFWSKCRDQGNPNKLPLEYFRYPGVRPQSRETAILAICDAVEAAARTLKKPEPAAIDSLVQRIVYGKMHLGQLDESGLAMADLRRIADSLRETIRHANHGRIEYPWQKAQQDASASSSSYVPLSTDTAPRLDSLDRQPRADVSRPSRMSLPLSPSDPPADPDVALADTRPTPQSSTASGRTPSSSALPIALDKVARDRSIASSAGGAGARAPSSSAPPASEEITHPERMPSKQPSGSRPVVPMTMAGVAPGPQLEQPAAHESLERRPTPPHGVPTDPVRASAEFVADAAAALAEAHRRTTPRTTQDVGPPDIISSSPAIATSIEPPAARKRAATLPPIPILRKPPTVPPPIQTTTLPGTVAPRPQALIVDDDAAAGSTQPRGMPVAPPEPSVDEPEAFAAATAPHGFPAARDTQPNLPLRAPAISSPAIAVPKSPWSRSLAKRIDAAMDDEFGAETPVSAPSRAELRALTDAPPEATRQQSIEEIERLHRAARDPDATRRAPHPTTNEVDPDDIVAAIELAPPAKRTGPIAVAKPKKPPG
jgi:putative nucleotidyltransferase with HDIG domain